MLNLKDIKRRIKSVKNTRQIRQDYEGYKLPEEKKLVLELIEEGLRIDESIHYT